MSGALYAFVKSCDGCPLKFSDDNIYDRCGHPDSDRFVVLSEMHADCPLRKRTLVLVADLLRKDNGGRARREEEYFSLTPEQRERISRLSCLGIERRIGVDRDTARDALKGQRLRRFTYDKLCKLSDELELEFKLSIEPRAH